MKDLVYKHTTAFISRKPVVNIEDFLKELNEMDHDDLNDLLSDAYLKLVHYETLLNIAMNKMNK